MSRPLPRQYTIGVFHVGKKSSSGQIPSNWLDLVVLKEQIIDIVNLEASHSYNGIHKPAQTIPALDKTHDTTDIF